MVNNVVDDTSIFIELHLFTVLTTLWRRLSNKRHQLITLFTWPSFLFFFISILCEAIISFYILQICKTRAKRFYRFVIT